MTREEQIQNYAYNNCIAEDVDDTSYSLIVSAIEWADETMIDKACEYLKANIQIPENVGNWYIENFIQQFRKAMEE